MSWKLEYPAHLAVGVDMLLNGLKKKPADVA